MRNLLAANHRYRRVIAALIRAIFDHPTPPPRPLGSAPSSINSAPTRPQSPIGSKPWKPICSPTPHSRPRTGQIWSHNPIERLNRELKRRTDVVGIFPDIASVIRLLGALLVEVNDEMIAAERRYIAAASVSEPSIEHSSFLASLACCRGRFGRTILSTSVGI
jgi:putative transposase